MKKITMFLLLALISGTSYAQKADTNKKKVKITIPKSDSFKNIKTYNIIIQGDDTWNATYAKKNSKTYENNVTKNTIEDYTKKDTTNPDVRVLMGYKGATYKRADNGTYLLDGDFKYLVLGKNNEILYEKGTNSRMYSGTYVNGKPNQSLASDLNNIGYKYLSDNNILITEKEFTLNYGLFEKAEEFSELVEFNTKTDEFLNKIAANSLDQSYLSELEKFYLSYVGKEYKKLKPKDYNKVIYLNLALTQMFLLNFDKSLEYLETAKQGAGMISLWPGEAQANITSLMTVNQKNLTAKVENPTFDSAYFIYINGSVSQNDKKLTGKLKTDRFANRAEGSIMDSNDPTAAKVWAYKDNGEVDFVVVNDKTTITTDKGLELKFISYDKSFILVEKTGDSCFKKYESNSNDVYCEKDGKFVIQK
ncbi:hypothetical protein [Flavobacterium collinsii]|uniref:Uncharacterized protein n=1 Tax=Flavobacterium collinsii TaxID=1114861 RepID=A0A9W4TFV7_9FLAO|nr:hypothetical protein [Flavobacterium collinsii]CAI2767363.1 conserved exported protein of unknown function [Flavobacterium collinsii]